MKRRTPPTPTLVSCHSCKEPFPEVQLGAKTERFLFRVLLLADSKGDSEKTFFCNEFCYNWHRHQQSDELDSVTGLTTGQLGSLLGSEGRIDWGAKDFDEVKTQTTLSTLSNDDVDMEEKPWVPGGVQGAACRYLKKPIFARQTASTVDPMSTV